MWLKKNTNLPYLYNIKNCYDHHINKYNRKKHTWPKNKTYKCLLSPTLFTLMYLHKIQYRLYKIKLLTEWAKSDLKLSALWSQHSCDMGTMFLFVCQHVCVYECHLLLKLTCLVICNMFAITSVVYLANCESSDAHFGFCFNDYIDFYIFQYKKVNNFYIVAFFM